MLLESVLDSVHQAFVLRLSCVPEKLGINQKGKHKT
jgi:hypothetical protein